MSQVPGLRIRGDRPPGELLRAPRAEGPALTSFNCSRASPETQRLGGCVHWRLGWGARRQGRTPPSRRQQVLKETGSGGRGGWRREVTPLGSRGSSWGSFSPPSTGSRRERGRRGPAKKGPKLRACGGLCRQHSLCGVGRGGFSAPRQAPESAETGGQASWPWRCRPWGRRAGEKGRGRAEATERPACEEAAAHPLQR